MEKKILFEIPALYRDDFRITGYTFGTGEQSACVVGSLRGNENQQLYVCAKLIERLKKLEAAGRIIEGKQILVVPSANAYSMNIQKRFWGIDNTDVNRMFPGYNEGETTQRIAGGLFEAIKDYEYGMQFASFYMPGHFVPHVRVMNVNDCMNGKLLRLAKDFGLPYVVSHEPRPFDTATLNYNWQVWETKAFSIYTTTTEEIDKESAEQAIKAILNFLGKQGVIDYRGYDGYVSQVVGKNDIVTVRNEDAGFIDLFVKAGERVEKGQVLAQIIDSYEGHMIRELISPVNGTILFARNESKAYQKSAVFKIIEEPEMW
ncbi:MAG: M14 family metallopeptidase [Lachnospiraceae bacterium]